jgi:hypothetical protein
VIRYFGSKDELFVRAAAFDLRMPDLSKVKRSQIGDTLIRRFLQLGEGFTGMTVLLRSAASNDYAASRVRELFAAQVLPAFARVGNRADAAERAVWSTLYKLLFIEVPHAGDATGEEDMEVMYPRCAGLDVHKEMVVACVRIASGGEASPSVRTFTSTTAGLIELSEWLEENGCTHVAMEATGVHWKPVWQVLADSSFELILANAAHVKNVPGRKTDVNDAMWLAELLAHGLVRVSFVAMFSLN